jgi:hypothetical protein
VEAFVDAGPGLRAAGYLDTEATWVAFASTAGQRVAGATTRATLDGIHQTATSAGSAHQTSSGSRRPRRAAAGAGPPTARAARRASRRPRARGLPGGARPGGGRHDADLPRRLRVQREGHLEGARSPSSASSSSTRPSRCRGPDRPARDRPALRRRGHAARPATPWSRTASPRLARPRPPDRQAAGTTRRPATRCPAARASARSRPTSCCPGDTSGRGAGRRRSSAGCSSPSSTTCRILDPKTQVATGPDPQRHVPHRGRRGAGAVGNLRFTQSFVEALAPGRCSASATTTATPTASSVRAW